MVRGGRHRRPSAGHGELSHHAQALEKTTFQIPRQILGVCADISLLYHLFYNFQIQ